MSNKPTKPSIQSFKLSSNLNQLYSSKREQTQQFIKDLSNNLNENVSKQKSRQKSSKKSNNTTEKQTSLFKLNTHSQSLVDQVPIDIIKKKSQSRLQSMNDQHQIKAKFNLLENQQQRKQNITKDRRDLLKKYNIDLNSVMSQQLTLSNPLASLTQQQDSYSTIKPSQTYAIPQSQSNPFIMPTIFQTPLLPCFSSQFIPNPFTQQSKTIREGQGVWRIGKIKIKGGKASIRIGDIYFQAGLASGEGRAVGIKQDFMYKMKSWSGIWIAQPKHHNI